MTKDLCNHIIKMEWITKALISAMKFVYFCSQNNLAWELRTLDWYEMCVDLHAFINVSFLWFAFAFIHLKKQSQFSQLLLYSTLVLPVCNILQPFLLSSLFFNKVIWRYGKNLNRFLVFFDFRKPWKKKN